MIKRVQNRARVYLMVLLYTLKHWLVILTWNWLVAARWILGLHLLVHLYFFSVVDDTTGYKPNKILWYLLLPTVSEALALYSAVKLVNPTDLRGGSESVIHGFANWVGVS